MDESKQLKLSYWEMVIIVLMLFTITAEGAGKNCSVSRCSSYIGPDIHFPFWLKQNNSTAQPADDCSSLPGFQLSCDESGVDHLYYKDATLVEYQNIVNTSIKGLQLSFKYSAIVEYIDYEDQYIHLVVTILKDIVPISTFDDSFMCHQPLPFYCNTIDYENFNYKPFTCCRGDYGYEQEYTFFNCSFSSAIIKYNGDRIIDLLSTRNFKVLAYSSDDNTISMLGNIRSCTKLYDISMPRFQMTSRRQYVMGVGNYLRWSTPIGGGKCEALRESCKKNYEDSRNTNAQSNTPDSEPSQRGSDNHATTKRVVLVLAVILPCIFLVGLGFIFLYNFIQSRVDKQKKEDELRIKMFMENYKALKPTTYSYSDIKKITNIKHKLGQGGYGSVFKGQISSDILVAVKVLHSDSKANGDDFINEVGTIGKIHHVNVVRLLGYCADGCNRALVYEFQPNHSLEKFVYKRENQQSFIGWKKMQKIALGIAKGIRYLHQGCEQQILHFDIKPNNILLDRHFNPKISDFGLAKLSNKGQSIVSMTAARGTIGYIAPEVFSRNFGNVSSKSDVYSFGMLLLEMVGGKDNDVEGEQNTSDVYFPEWIFHRLEKGGELVIQIENEDDSKIVRKLTTVGLWCIGWHPVDRPSIKLVIQMLEADECPAMPPNPFTSTTSGNAKSIFSERLQVISEAE